MTHATKGDSAMADELRGKTIAVLATDGVEQVELTKPVEALKQAGATVHVVAPHGGGIQAFNHHDKGDTIKVDKTLAEVSPDSYDGLVLPGGVINPDQLRMVPEAIGFVREYAKMAKPIAAICHGPWTLIDADVVSGKTMTSWPSLQRDLLNAGARWMDQEVVTDTAWSPAATPDDLPAFCAKMVEEFREGSHTGRRASA